eukprot:Selendium_serpulae@DN5492_c0_g1_i1.p1
MRVTVLATLVACFSCAYAQPRGPLYPSRAVPDGRTLQFCDNVEIEATQDGLKVELLLQPFGLVCVMADMLSGGRLGQYMEDGLVTWKLNTEEYLSGMSDGEPSISFTDVSQYFANLAHNTLPGSHFGTAFTATVMGLEIDTPTDIVSGELAARLGQLPLDASQFDVLGAVMGMASFDTPLDLEDTLISRFQHPEAASVEVAKNLLMQAQHTAAKVRGGVRSPESVREPGLVVNALNMMSPTGQYNNPAGPFIFPDRAMTSMVGEGERRRNAHARPQQAGSGGVIRDQLGNLMPF